MPNNSREKKLESFGALLDVLDILRQLRIKASGFSKYCIGSVTTNGALKRNLFKPKLVRVSKLARHQFIIP